MNGMGENNVTEAQIIAAPLRDIRPADRSVREDAMVRLADEVDRLNQVVAKQEREAERDCEDYERVMEAADRLAYAIASTDVIGEHSSGNDPWDNALDALHQERILNGRIATAVQDALADHPEACEATDEPISCGWKRAVLDVQNALREASA